MKVVILTGGKGTRLGLQNIPKPMVLVDGLPLLLRLVQRAKEAGLTEFLFLNGYLSEVIERYFGDGSNFGVQITHVQEQSPMGTAGAFAALRHQLTDLFIVLYGDILMDVDLAQMAHFARAKGGAGSIFVHPNDHPFDSDLLQADENCKVIEFYPKPHDHGARLPNLVSAAIYALFPISLTFVPQEGASDWGRDIFPKIIKSADLFSYKSIEYAKDIGTPSRLRLAEEHFKSGRTAKLSLRNLKPAIFLDRDGVIIEDRDGLVDTRGVALLDHVGSALRRANDAGIPVICVTNQPVLAKGLLTRDGLRSIQAEIDSQIATTQGGYIDDVFVCPHHPEAGWPGEVRALKIICDCRKPKPGLLLRAADLHNIDLTRSWLVGDRYADIAAGKAAGTKTILVRTGHNGKDRSNYSVEPDLVFDHLGLAIDHILGVSTC